MESKIGFIASETNSGNSFYSGVVIGQEWKIDNSMSASGEWTFHHFGHLHQNKIKTFSSNLRRQCLICLLLFSARHSISYSQQGQSKPLMEKKKDFEFELSHLKHFHRCIVCLPRGKLLRYFLSLSLSECPGKSHRHHLKALSKSQSF